MQKKEINDATIMLSIEISEKNRDVMQDIANELIQRGYKIDSYGLGNKIIFSGSQKHMQLDFGENCITDDKEIIAPESLSLIAEMQGLKMTVSEPKLPEDYKPTLTAAPNAPDDPGF